jgi:hypothetical protein
MSIAYYLEPNSAGTSFTGGGTTIDGTFPSGSIPCTQAQADSFQSLVPDGKGGIKSAPAAALLAAAKTAQIAAINAAYEAAVSAPVSFKTAAGTTAMFSPAPKAIGYLQGVIASGSAAWTADLWLSNAGTPITPFTFADVRGLAAAIEAVETPDYHKMLTLISEVNSATTVSAVQGVIWA